MSSNVGQMLEQLFEDAVDEIDKKMQKAFNSTMRIVKDELNRIAQEKAVRNFYAGYDPVMYCRTNQLTNAISVDLKDTSSPGSFSFSVRPILDERMMDHSEYDVNITYKQKKNKKYTGGVKTYKCHVKLKKKPDEEKILNMTLGAGYHPKVGTANTEAPIWDEDDNGVFIDAIVEYITNKVPTIFEQEYNKLR